MIIGGALMAVTSLKIFRAAIYLLFSLIGIAGLYFWLNYEFIAAVQIVVYVGGIVVLIIFSIFLTHHSGEDMKAPKMTRAVFAAIAASAGFALTLLTINRHSFFKATGSAVEPSVNNIGMQMLSTTEHGYLLPFEVISMLLLAAMIGAIVIAIKIKPKA
jgi:NADH-quinone oxidoreductase subunit J